MRLVQPGDGEGRRCVRAWLWPEPIGLKGGDGRGLLTAGKVLGLPLWGTELVVLSACDTGRGEVKRGEGLFGLRRCILQAGAQSLVMSLWRVSDRESRELMAAF